MAFPARANISPILEAHFSRLLIAGIKEHSALLFPFEEALKELADTLLDYLAGVQRDGGCADWTCDLERHHNAALAILEKGNRFAAPGTGGNIRRQGHLDPKIQRWRSQTHLAAAHRLH